MGECIAPAASEAHNEERLTAGEKTFLLRLARTAVETHVTGMPLPAIEDNALTDRLREKRAAFVTLRNDRVLRGCVGHSAHRVGLAHAVQANAVHAACRDPRFHPIFAAEVKFIAIEISVLSRGASPSRPFTPVSDPKSIVIGRDGLYLEHAHGYTGILLPQVPVEQCWTVDDFLEGICQKAGLPCDAWRDRQTRLYRFSAEVFSEESTVHA
jgi:AmmeMemoRadiSam system protein A